MERSSRPSSPKSLRNCLVNKPLGSRSFGPRESRACSPTPAAYITKEPLGGSTRPSPRVAPSDRVPSRRNGLSRHASRMTSATRVERDSTSWRSSVRLTPSNRSSRSCSGPRAGIADDDGPRSRSDAAGGMWTALGGAAGTEEARVAERTIRMRVSPWWTSISAIGRDPTSWMTALMSSVSRTFLVSIRRRRRDGPRFQARAFSP